MKKKGARGLVGFMAGDALRLIILLFSITFVEAFVMCFQRG
jgi:hypothetical protein